MRWMFQDSSSSAASEHETMVKLIDAWWAAFEEKAGAIKDLLGGGDSWSLPDWIHANLHSIDPKLMWEFGPAVHSSGRRLVITPEHNHGLRPLVTTILERAPKLTDWEFYGYRLPESHEAAKSSVEARTGADIDGLLVKAVIGDSNRIKISFCAPYCKSADDEEVFAQAFVATEIVLGEEMLDTWIGEMGMHPFSRKKGLLGLFKKKPEIPSGFFPIDRLASMVKSVRTNILEQLPRTALHEIKRFSEPDSENDNADDSKKRPKDEWERAELYERKPAEKEKYSRREDLVLGVAKWGELGHALRSSGFYSCRYSRHGEVFCYVKLSLKDLSMEEQFEQRKKINHALSKNLVAKKLGCVIGDATGLQYAYIDLALTLLSEGVKVVQSTLQNLSVGRESWIEFYDEVYCDEWVGICKDSPEPVSHET